MVQQGERQATNYETEQNQLLYQSPKMQGRKQYLQIVRYHEEPVQNQQSSNCLTVCLTLQMLQ